MNIANLLKEHSFDVNLLSNKTFDNDYILRISPGFSVFDYYRFKPEDIVQLVETLDKDYLLENVVVGNSNYVEVGRGKISITQLKKILGTDFLEDKRASEAIGFLIQAQEQLSAFNNHDDNSKYKVDESIKEAQGYVKKVINTLQNWRKRDWLKFPYMTQEQVFKALEAYREALCSDDDDKTRSWNDTLERYRSGRLFERDVHLIEFAWNQLVKKS